MKNFLCLDLVAAIDEILIFPEWDMTWGGGGGFVEGDCKKNT
jgi:hypothetical protein